MTSYRKAAFGSLTYSAKTKVYTYTWPVKGRWAGTCRLLRLRLDDGTEHEYEAKVVKP